MKELALNNIPSFYVEILQSWNMIKNIKGECDQDKTDQQNAIISPENPNILGHP